MTPAVTILLATHNGAPWLHEQLDSLLTQQGVAVRVVASDDASTDATPALLERAARDEVRLQVLPSSEPFGAAGRNFYRLIKDADIGNASYVALSDQDDVWFTDKLQRAIEVLVRTGCGGYSSNFIAWYPHRAPARQQVPVDKAQPQRRWDHLMQGPGPGCTFVMTREYFLALRAFVREHHDAIGSIRYHDWLIYAHARSQGVHWHIDPNATLLYRQHDKNDTGASIGWRALGRRLDLVRQGWLRSEALAIARILGLQALPPVQHLQRWHVQDRLALACMVGQLRRKRSEQLKLAAAFLFLMP
jgi:rhamnosyltransferase